MKILLFGSKGYIGSEFVDQIEDIQDIELTTMHSRRLSQFSPTYKELDTRIKEISPDVVINCAAYVGGNSIVNCEGRKDTTISSNVIFPLMLAEVCDDHGIVFGHISSGCVYDGYPEGGYKENDLRNLTFTTKCSFYTGTKAFIEDLLVSIEKKYIWRIRLPFDEKDHPRNYLTKVMQFDKLLNMPNSISNRKELVRACLESIINKIPFGTYHVTNPGSITAEEIVEMIKRIHHSKKKFQYFKDIEELNVIRKIPTSNVILNTDKLSKTGIHMMPIHDSIEWSLTNWVPSKFI